MLQKKIKLKVTQFFRLLNTSILILIAFLRTVQLKNFNFSDSFKPN